MLVPSYRSYRPGAVVERMPTPGAATMAARSEKEARTSSGPVAPTEMRLSILRFAGNDGEEAPPVPRLHRPEQRRQPGDVRCSHAGAVIPFVPARRRGREDADAWSRHHGGAIGEGGEDIVGTGGAYGDEVVDLEVRGKRRRGGATGPEIAPTRAAPPARRREVQPCWCRHTVRTGPAPWSRGCRRLEPPPWRRDRRRRRGHRRDRWRLRR